MAERERKRRGRNRAGSDVTKPMNKRTPGVIRAFSSTHKIMRNVLLFLIALYCFPARVAGQPNDFSNNMETIYSVKEFRQIADSMQLSVIDLFDYPVISPVKQPVISSGFGIRKHPVYRVRKFHTGIDFPKAKGTPVYATGNGVVIRKGCNSGYGNFIEIQHKGGFRSYYAHLSRTLVNSGDSVSITQQIACVGNTGLTTGYHLHYEIRKGNYFLNPTEWCYCLWKMGKANSTPILLARDNR